MQTWNVETQQGFLLQQLRNQALELGIVTIGQRAEAALEVAKVPWFQQRFPTGGESRALVRTLEGHIGGCFGVALSADGRLVISAGADIPPQCGRWP